MNHQLLTSIVGGAGFLVATLAAYWHLRRQLRHGPTAVLLAGALAIFSNSVHFARSLHATGMLETFRHSFEATLLLATLLGLVGMATHLSSMLRGLDGFLFAGATLVQFASLMVRSQSGNEFTYKPWFITHSFAFALSGALFIAAGAAGIAYLLVSRVLRRKRPSMLVGAVAPLESLERFARWTLMLGFPLFTYGVLTGICEMVRSRNPGPGAWLLDPLVLLSFLTWALYAVMVGLMVLRPAVRGRRLAALATCGMCLVGVVFLVVELISPLHR